MPRPPRIRVMVDVEPTATLTRERAHRDAVRYVLGQQLKEPGIEWRITAVESFDRDILFSIIWDPETGERRSDWPAPA